VPRRGHWLARLGLLALGAAGVVDAVPATAASTPARTIHATAASTPARTIHATAASAPAPTVTATVGDATEGAAMPKGYVGVSLEFPAIRAYTGTNARAVDPVLVHLLRALAPGGAPVIRIGGNSADHTWWPLKRTKPPAGVTYSLSSGWMATTRALAHALRARLIVGVNLAANRTDLAAAEGKALVSGLGRSAIEALEIGNEPDVYNQFPWYYGHGGLGVYARPQSWDLGTFEGQFARWGRLLPASTPLAGPAFAELGWLSGLPQFLSGAARLKLVTIHRYPLRACVHVPIEPGFASIPSLLADTSSAGLAESLAPYAREAHDAGFTFRVGEMNSASCTGKKGVSDTFASSLWALDTLFNLASVGIDGVNFHSLPGAPYAFAGFAKKHGRWQASVHPAYYGWLLFTQAFPPGAKLLPVDAPPGTLKIWATRSTTGRTRVVLINKSTNSAAHVNLAVPAAGGRASLEWLKAPAVNARSGVTLGGRTFGTVTRTGTLGAPRTTPVRASQGSYSLTVPAASAVMLTQ
jgi:hypothetical protein